MIQVLVKLPAKHGAHGIGSVPQAASLDGLSFLFVESRCLIQSWYHVLVESVIHYAMLLPFLVIPQSINTCLEQRFPPCFLQVQRSQVYLHQMSVISLKVLPGFENLTLHDDSMVLLHPDLVPEGVEQSRQVALL